jgi:hypothetical protein
MRATGQITGTVVYVALAGDHGLARRAKIPDVASLIWATLAEFCVATEFRDVPERRHSNEKATQQWGLTPGWLN